MGILRDLNVSSGGRRDSTSNQVGVLASEIPTGFPLPPLLTNDIDSGFPNRLYSVEILTLPSAGVLFVGKASDVAFTGAPDGTYTGSQRIRKFDPGVGIVSTADTTYSFAIGGTSPVTSVTVSPSTAGGSTNFSAVANGTGSPPQIFTWAAAAGTINASTGAFTAPAQTNTIQTITITATHTASGMTGTATVTIPAASSGTSTYNYIRFNLQDTDDVPLANVSGLKWALFAQATPDLFAAPVAQGALETTDGSAAGEIPVPALSVPVGRYWLLLTNSDGTTTQSPPADSFSCPVMVVA